jgi:hypothetical protein
MRRVTARWPRRLFLSIGGVLILGLSFASVSSQRAAAVMADGKPVSNTTHINTRLTGVMAAEVAVQKLGAKSFAGVYGGFAVVDNQQRVAVYLTRDDPGIEKEFRAAVGAGRVVFRKTPNSVKNLNVIQAVLEKNWNKFDASGLNLIQFGPNTFTGREDIGVENLTARQAATLRRLFGASAIHVYNVTAKEVKAGQLTASRTEDTAPYNGGDAIVNGSLSNACSSGFGVTIGGSPRLLTAAHCFPNNGWIFNLYCDGNPNLPPLYNQCYNAQGGKFVEGSNNPMGQVDEIGITGSPNSTGGHNWTGIDSEVFTGCNKSGVCGGDDLIWAGSPGNSGVRETVSGVGSWGPGTLVCSSGAYGGEICGFLVLKTNQCDTFGEGSDNFHFCHLTEVGENNDGDTFVHGDSGGPVYAYSGGTVKAMGTVTAVTGADSWFTGIDGILSNWHATLITG